MAKHRRRRHYGDTVSVKLAGIGIPQTVKGKDVLVGALFGVGGVALAKLIVKNIPAGVTAALPDFVNAAITGGVAVPLLGGVTSAVLIGTVGKKALGPESGGYVVGALSAGLGATVLNFLAQNASTQAYFGDTVSVKLAGMHGVIIDDNGGPQKPQMNGVIIDDAGGPQKQLNGARFQGYMDNPALEGVMLHAYKDAEDDDVP